MATKSKKTAANRITSAKAKAIKGAKSRATKAAKAKPAKAAAKAKPAAGAPKAGTKTAKLLAMLAGKGATNAELCKALGWQPHTLRAAISRVKGKVQRSRVDGITSYRIEA